MESCEPSEADSEDKLAWKDRLLDYLMSNASVFLMTVLVLSTVFGVIAYQITAIASLSLSVSPGSG